MTMSPSSIDLYDVYDVVARELGAPAIDDAPRCGHSALKRQHLGAKETYWCRHVFVD